MQRCSNASICQVNNVKKFNYHSIILLYILYNNIYKIMPTIIGSSGRDCFCQRAKINAIFKEIIKNDH